MTDASTTARLRIRWGWFAACIVLGAAGILLGLIVAPATDRAGYLASVLGGAGTTLFLVGIVVLLERRIVDTAVRVVRNAAEEERLRTDAIMREQVQGLEDRIAAMWAASETPEDVARSRDQTRRMTDEFTERIVDEFTQERPRRPSGDEDARRAGGT